jgi:hypothetical protein
MALPHLTLSQLAQQTAAQIGFTVRRWWREKTNPQVLRVEVERCLVGAPPAIAVLTVAIPGKTSARPPSPARTTIRSTRRVARTRRRGQRRKS